jgi:hypothetical protein
MGLLPIKPAEVLFSYTGPDTLVLPTRRKAL